MTDDRFVLGLDFGTGSVRAVLVACADGAEVAAGSVGYERGADGVILDDRDPDLARQHPDDWIDAAADAVRAALEVAKEREGFAIEQVVGIGIDTTASTPLPVDAANRPLARDPAFADDPAALAWLWKDHTSQAAARDITAAAAADRPQFLTRCGGSYSSEWFWAKVLHAARTAPKVAAAAASWVEACDWVPAVLCGIDDPAAIRRSVCAAGHKGLFADDWGGPPDADWLASLHPELARLRQSLPERAFAATEVAGHLDAAMAERFGLAAGTPVAVGAIDAHLGALGAGVAAGDLVKVLGTSTCDMAVAALDDLPDIPGIAGIVRDSIVPGMVGFEAGQAAVGDAFAWCVRELWKGEHADLEAAAAAIPTGASGLLALDWWNGNRCVLADQALTGMVVGLNLRTTTPEIYRALVESTAYGARAIVDRLVGGGVPVDRVVACGGIARKSPFVLQVLADVLDREIVVAGSQETCALGAAICAAVAAGEFPDVVAAQRALCPAPEKTYTPDPDAVAIHARLYDAYRRCHDAFGGVWGAVDLGPVMKELLAIRTAVRR